MALAVGSLLITLAISLQHTVMRAGETLSAGDQRWMEEQFLRTQMRALDARLSTDVGLIAGDVERFSVVSRRSGRHGADGPPVLVTYRFVPQDRALFYREVAIPAWWAAQPGDPRVALDELRYRTDETVWNHSFFTGIDRARFEYWDAEQERWRGDTDTLSDLPKAIRLTLSGPGVNRTLVIDLRASSFSSSSGS